MFFSLWIEIMDTNWSSSLANILADLGKNTQRNGCSYQAEAMIWH